MNLTAKDIDYIRRIAMSETRKEIAAAWKRSEKAIGWRAEQVGKKMHWPASDYAAITRFAIRNRLVRI